MQHAARQFLRILLIFVGHRSSFDFTDFKQSNIVDNPHVLGIPTINFQLELYPQILESTFMKVFSRPTTHSTQAT